MSKQLNEIALGISGAIVSAAVMVLLGILGNIGLYTGAVSMMQGWHMFFSISPIGIIGGAIEAALISFVLLYALGFVYNKFA